MDNSNKKIVKNSLFLYLRMLLVMAVSLYTSRIVLYELGVDDYGIFSAVGGFIILFTFISQAISTGTQRYITFELGKPDGNISDVFGTSIVIHLVMALSVIICAQTIGLWFLNHRMNFPCGSMDAVNWTYQMTVLTCVISIFQFPFNALVLAHEKMNFFAYTSVVEVVLKLLSVYLLELVPGYKLEFFAVINVLVASVMLIWYMLFSHRNFPGAGLRLVFNKPLLKEISSFSGWAILGSSANVGFQQGVNVILNIFYGVGINAAVGIANQVNGAVMRFVTSFQQAINPQLIKSEASHSTGRQMSLIEKSAKFSYLIMLFIAYPLIINMEYVMKIWLTEIPPHTVGICRLIILGALVETISGPLWVTIFATGKIRLYQTVVSAVLLLNLPFSYLSCRYDWPLDTVFIIRIVLFVAALGVRLIFLRKMVDLSIMQFLKRVILPVTSVSIAVILMTSSLKGLIIGATDLSSFLISCSILCMLQVVSIYTLGLSGMERRTIKAVIVAKFH